jgi:alpha-tubulin suppressor-like RCC1 family protein/Leucine-rich repeat (LRR) protein
MFSSGRQPNEKEAFMKSIKTALILMILLTCHLALSAAIPAAERQALIDLYNSTNGAGWTNKTNWLGAEGTENTWHGVYTDDGNTTVTELHIDNNNLVGTIPASLGNLSNLTYLCLNSNHLTGSIPPELGSLTNLQYLLLYSNQLSGGIPKELGYLDNLKFLYLSSNQLTGSIPSSLGNLWLSLGELHLDSNQLTGSIPPELGNLNLANLTLNSNQLTGSIPPGLGHVGYLRGLNLSSNQLTGSIPPEFGNRSYLQVLMLSSNQLTGSIPSSFGNLNNLNGLYLSSNQLTGSIPTELGNLANLQKLDLSSNQLTGSIPTSLTGLTSLGSSDTDIGYNALHTSNAALITFLNSKDPDWASTQTIAPTNVSAVPGNLTVTVSWTPIAYAGDTGGYRVSYATVPGGPYTFYAQTANKSVSSQLVSGLVNGTPYYFVVQTRTEAHANNQNVVDSEDSDEVSAAPAIQGTIAVTSPNGGESWVGGSSHNITWTTTGTIANVKIESSTNSGSSYTPVIASTANTGSYAWTVPNTPSATCLVRVSDVSNSLVNDASNATFTIAGAIPSAERQALIDLYNSTNGASWTNKTNWLGAAGTENTWYGVTTDAGNTTVLQLQLSGNNLVGALPANLADLSNLTHLDLAMNQLSGSIPTELSNLSRLRFLWLNMNKLTGSIPSSLGNLNNLQYLFLYSNQLTGSIPSSLGDLSNLQHLDLSSNKLTGSIPTSLANLNNLATTLNGIGYNALHTADPALIAFLNSKDPDWAATQTIAPTNVSVVVINSTSVLVSWTPITYTGDTGGYRVSYANVAGGPYTFYAQTANKNASSEFVSGLTRGAPYHFVVQTRTDVHANNQNVVDSEKSDEAATPAIRATGSIVAWGYNATGQCNVPAGNNFSGLGAGESHSVALRSDGSLAAWGSNTLGQLNVPAGSDYVAVAGGWNHNLALKQDGSLVAWGQNDYGQCNVPAGNMYVAIAAGGMYSLALKSDGSLAAWGRNDYGQCNVPTGNIYTAIAAGRYHSVALKQDGSLVAWGRNNYNQCIVPAGNDYVAIAAGLEHCVALKSNLSLVGWGRNNYGQISVPAGYAYMAIAAGYQYSMALRADGSIVAWGDNTYGQLNVPAGNHFMAIAAGYYHGLAIADTSAISGKITIGSTGLANVLLSGLPGDPITDASGAYTASVDYGWSGTVIPTLSGYTFSPVNRVYSNVITGQTAQDYAATMIPSSITVTSPNGGESWVAGSTHDIAWSSSGAVGDIRIRYSIDSGSTWTVVATTTANDGSYTWTIPATPSMTCLVEVGEASDGIPNDVSNAAFTIVAGTYTVSGTVTLNGSPLQNVVLSGLPGNPVTNASGVYAGTVTYGWSATVTPALAGYTFTPASRAYSDVQADATAQDYTARLRAYTVSGTVTLGSSPLPDVVLSGLPGNPVTDASGAYSAAVDHGWSGTVTPTLGWHTFTPPSRTYTNVSGELSSQDFAATVVSGIQLTSPNGGEYWGKGTTQMITWTYGGDIGAKVKIMLYKGTVLSKTLTLGTPTANGSFAWKIPATMSLGNIYKIKITSATNAAYTDMSDAPFNIVAESITVVAPNGGEKLIAGTTQTISWTYKGSPGASVKLELYKGGSPDSLITLSAPVGSLGKGSFGWTIPSDQPCGQDYSVKISSVTNGLIFDASNAGFRIYSGLVKAWGSNVAGELGDGTTFDSNFPVPVNALSAVKTLAAGRNFSAALRSDGTVRTWGLNDSGQLGNGTFIGSLSPVQVTGLSGITVIAAGGSFALGLKSTGLVQAWGENGEGQLGNAKTIDSNVPVSVSGTLKYKAIAAGSIHAAAVAADGTVRAWGSNYYGQLGIGTSGNISNKPVKVLNLTGGLAVAAGAGFTAVLKKDGTVWVCGDGAFGQLGNGTNGEAHKVVKALGLTGVKAIAAGGFHLVALRSDGTVWTWGLNDKGQLGNGGGANSSLPTQVIGLSGVAAVAAGNSHTLAVKSDGTLWAWGLNDCGQLGNSGNVDSNVPVLVGGLNDLVAVAAGYKHTLALR